MSTTISILLIIVLSFLLVHTLLTMVIVKRMNGMMVLFQKRPELPLSLPAPDFRTRSLTGDLISLRSYAETAVLFMFIHPLCNACERKLPLLERLAPLALQADNLQFVLVIEADHQEAKRMADHHQIKLPILVAPRDRSELAQEYNPDGFYPYYCLIDEQTIVRSRGTFGTKDWLEMQQRWESVLYRSAPSSAFSRYT